MAHLDATETRFDYVEKKLIEDQTYVTVKRGSEEEPKLFVKEQAFLQVAYQWIGYLVDGGVEAVLTLIFS